jgi:hypothetical protein
MSEGAQMYSALIVYRKVTAPSLIRPVSLWTSTKFGTVLCFGSTVSFAITRISLTLIGYNAIYV